MSVTLTTNNLKSACNICYESESSQDTELMNVFSLGDTGGSLSSSDNLKQNLTLIYDYLSLRYGENNTAKDEEVSSEY